MYLRRITQFTSSSSAKLLLLSTTSTTSSALLQDKNYYTSTQMMRAASASAAQAAARLSSPKKFSSRHVHASSNFFSSKKTRGFQQKRSFSLTTRAMGAKVGDQISGVLQLGPWIDGMPTPVDMAERCKGKKVFLIGLPGASLLFFPFTTGFPASPPSILILMENTKEILRFFYVYAYRRKENNAFTDHVAIFFQVLSHLHDPRVKFRVILPDKIN